MVPADPDARPAWSGAWETGIARGWWGADGWAGPQAGQLVGGGFVRVRREEGACPHFVANGQGGFQVRCPRTGAPVVEGFGSALTAWRDGGPRRLDCPACGEVHDLARLDFRPPAAFAWGVLHLADVGAAHLEEEAEAALSAVLGPIRVIARRVPRG